jgi:hypothetical protein
MTHVLPFFSEMSCCHGRRDSREGLAQRSLLSTSSLPLPPSLGRKAPAMTAVSAAAYGYPWHVQRHGSEPKTPPLAGDADDAEIGEQAFRSFALFGVTPREWFGSDRLLSDDCLEPAALPRRKRSMSDSDLTSLYAFQNQAAGTSDATSKTEQGASKSESPATSSKNDRGRKSSFKSLESMAREMKRVKAKIKDAEVEMRIKSDHFYEAKKAMDQRNQHFSAGLLSNAMEKNAANKQQQEWHRESANEKTFKLCEAMKTYGATIRGLQEELSYLQTEYLKSRSDMTKAPVRFERCRSLSAKKPTPQSTVSR